MFGLRPIFDPTAYHVTCLFLAEFSEPWAETRSFDANIGSKLKTGGFLPPPRLPRFLKSQNHSTHNFIVHLLLFLSYFLSFSFPLLFPLPFPLFSAPFPPLSPPFCLMGVKMSVFALMGVNLGPHPPPSPPYGLSPYTLGTRFFTPLRPYAGSPT